MELKGSRYGCHMNNTFVGALCYTDDVTLLSPSIRGLNPMISLCEVFAKYFDITFNCKRTVCIKFGQKLIDCENVHLNDKKIEWVNQIKHLGNYIDRNLNDSIDCTHKKSIFIGQVNKLCANFGRLQMPVLVRLFETYCCTFYGSQMWQINSQSTNSVCTSWNKGVRRILNLPHDTHSWLLGPLLKQNLIKKQFIVRTLRFPFRMLKSHNGIVEVCTLDLCMMKLQN